jgi:hypothetical protein
MRGYITLLTVVGYASAKSDLWQDMAKYHRDVFAPNGWLQCTACQTSVSVFASYLEDYNFMKPYVDELINTCHLFLKPYACQGFERMQDTVFPQLNAFDLKPDFFCEEVYPACATDLY